MRKRNYKIIIKGSDKGVGAKVKGVCNPVDIMEGLTHVLVESGAKLGYTIDDIIEALQKRKKDEESEKGGK